MARDFLIDEQVAQGLLKLLGHASFSMSRAREWSEEAYAEEPRQDAEPAAAAEEDDPALRRLSAF